MSIIGKEATNDKVESLEYTSEYRKHYEVKELPPPVSSLGKGRRHLSQIKYTDVLN